MITPEEKDFIAKANIFYEYTKDSKWNDADGDKTSLWEKVYAFINDTDKAKVSKSFKYRSYGYVLNIIHYHANGGYNNLACEMLIKQAQNSPDNNDEELRKMAIQACMYGRHADRMMKEKVLFNIYNKLEDKSNFTYIREVEAYKIYSKQQNRLAKREISDKKLADIDEKIRQETSPEKRLKLLDEKIKNITASAYGRVNSFKMKSSVCAQAIDIIKRELPTMTDAKLYYEREMYNYNRNADNSMLRVGQISKEEIFRKYSNHRR